MKIRDKRIEAGMTQKEAAAAICVTSGAFCQWEKGKICPRAEHLKAIAELFNCTVDELF